MRNSLFNTPFVSAVILGVSYVAFTADAVSAAQLTAATSAPVAAKYIGSVNMATVERLSQAATLENAGPRIVQRPPRRLPNGQSTTQLRPAPVNTLLNLQSNTNVQPRPAQSGPSQKLGQIVQANGFIGIVSHDNDTTINGELEPPDQGLAVRANVIAEINNEVLKFYNSSGSALTGDLNLNTFFSTTLSVGDTQAFYDYHINRWIFTQIISDFGSTNGFGVAVSATSNPTGAYHVYFVSSFSNDLSGCGGANCFGDYPKVGYDQNGLYISADLFSNINGNFVAAATYALPLTPMLTGAGFSYVRLTYPSDFVVQPSIPTLAEPFVTAGNGTEYLMEARNITDGSHNIRVWAIENTNNIVSNPTSLQGHGIDLAAESYGPTVPSAEPNQIGSYCASQGATTSTLLDGGYNAFQATVQEAGGALHAALPFGTTDSNGLARDSIAWFNVTPSIDGSGNLSASITSQGYLVPPAHYSISYPAEGLNKISNGVMAMTITSNVPNTPGAYPSAAFVQMIGGKPYGPITIVGAGTFVDDGFSGCGGVGRWGDYGAAVQDSATGTWYTASEMIGGQRGNSTNWGTFITQVK